ncbi:MAG: ATP synthase F0 subunit B [Clostridiales bacterium]|nr:ATP synthase F0 subunit B [Clostridiales bacterium]
MTVEELLEQLDDTIDRAFSFPLSGGRCVVDAERVREIIDDIRLNLPQELKQAKAIVSDRNDIISTARRESEAIIRSAEERARALVAQEEIIRQAQQKANDMLSQAQLKSREMRKAANDYADDLMKRTDEALTANLQELRQARQALRTPPRKTDE